MEIAGCLVEHFVGVRRDWETGFPWKEVGLWSKNESLGFEVRVVVAMAAMRIGWIVSYWKWNEKNRRKVEDLIFVRAVEWAFIEKPKSDGWNILIQKSTDCMPFLMEGDRIWKAQEVPFGIFSCKVTSAPKSMVYHYQPVASLVFSAASSLNKPFLTFFFF